MPDSRTYSEVEQIMGQFFVAFGQGTGCVRGAPHTIAAIRHHYVGMIEQYSASWEEDAVQVLERVRTVGRLAALNSLQHGSSTIGPEDFEAATGKVQHQSRTRWCG